MNILIKLTIILISSIALSGCLKTVEQLGWGNFDRPVASPTQIQPTPIVEQENLGVQRVRKIGIAPCDSYLDYMVCATSQLDTVIAEQMMDEITQDWSQTDTETLTAQCTQIVKEIQESPEQYANGLNCTTAVQPQQ